MEHSQMHLTHSKHQNFIETKYSRSYSIAWLGRRLHENDYNPNHTKVHRPTKEVWRIYYTLDISRYNITRHCTQHNNFGKSMVRLGTQERQTFLTMSYGCLSWVTEWKKTAIFTYILKIFTTELFVSTRGQMIGYVLWRTQENGKVKVVF